MKAIGKVFSYTLLAVNVFFACTLLLIAYSPYIHPQAHPIESCMGLAFPIFLIINVLFFIFWLLINFRFALFPLVVLLICYPQIRLYMPINYKTKEIPENSIKLLSYNVMGFNHIKDEKENNKVLNYIRNSNADIICLQEYNTSGNEKYLTNKDVVKALSDYPYQRVTKVGKNGGDNRIALFSKFPILSTRRIDYPSQYNGSAMYELKIGNDTVLLINNHLESNKLTAEDKAKFNKMIKEPDKENVKLGATQLIKKLAEASAIRSIQADSIAKVIEQSPHRPVIVCGDFNDNPISYTHRVIGENLNDAFEKSGKGLGISYNQNRFYFRIDHILTSKNIDVFNCTVDRSISESDHYPIITYLKINK